MDIISDKVPVVLGEAQLFRPWSPELGAYDLPSAERFAGVHKSAFADTANREYPLTDRGLVFFGAIHYRGRGGNDPQIVERFEKAAAAHGLTAELAAYEPFFSQSVKSASADEPAVVRCALRVKSASGVVEAYPLTCQEDIAPAAANACTDFLAGRLPLPLFGQAAREVVKAASEYGVGGLPKSIYEAGILCLPDMDQTNRHLPKDAPAELLEAYGKIAEAAQHASDDERDILAEAWDRLDGALSRQRPRDQGTPYGVLWGGAPRELVVKAAREFALFDKLGAHTLVPRAVVASINMERASQHLRSADSDILGRVVKQAADSQEDPNVLLISLDAPTQQRLLRAVLSVTE
jgi:hypothetical protein